VQVSVAAEWQLNIVHGERLLLEEQVAQTLYMYMSLTVTMDGQQYMFSALEI
jgi:hypothetical protein